MKTVMEAYGLRWRAGEYHRQIKQDYGLEKICLRNYNAIKKHGRSGLTRGIVLRASARASRYPNDRGRRPFATKAIPLYSELSVLHAYRRYRLGPRIGPKTTAKTAPGAKT